MSFAKPPNNDNIKKDFISVLLKIELKERKNFFIYDESTSAFDNEREALLQEGLKFKIIKKEKFTHEDGWIYY